jgi:hypothetical protein
MGRRALLEAGHERRDRVVSQVGEEVRLPVVQRALRERSIEQTVLRAVRDRAHLIHDRRPERLDRLHGLLTVGERAAMAREHADELGIRAVRRRQQAGREHDLVR